MHTWKHIFSWNSEQNGLGDNNMFPVIFDAQMALFYSTET